MAGRSKKSQKSVKSPTTGKRHRVYTSKAKAVTAKDRAPSTQRIYTHKDKYGTYYTVRTVR